MALSLSVLDLAPVSSGMTAAQALQNTMDLARRAEALGYTRYWLAEHHNMPGLASAAPEILIGQIARETHTLRVGSGGIMLPNHAPLQVAEAFQTLETLFPGRIDLGIGRAPGTDPRAALALRRTAPGAEDLSVQLDELFGFAGDGFPEGYPLETVRAFPDAPLPPVWLLGSSDYSARLAARRGLGFVFARHINPYGAADAMRLYREHFIPSSHLPAPRCLVAVSVICAETEARAEEMALPLDLAWLRLQKGQRLPFPSPAEAQTYSYSFRDRMQMSGTRDKLILGDPAQVQAQLCALAAETGAEEILATTMVYDHEDRVRSYALLAEAMGVRGEKRP